MPITPFLRNRGFDQAAIQNLSTVFVAVCCRLGLADRSDPATELVASKIIELAQRGVRDSETLREMTLQDFNVIEANPTVNRSGYQEDLCE
jgi:hypothetical protein